MNKNNAYNKVLEEWNIFCNNLVNFESYLCYFSEIKNDMMSKLILHT